MSERGPEELELPAWTGWRLTGEAGAYWSWLAQAVMPGIVRISAATSVTASARLSREPRSSGESGTVRRNDEELEKRPRRLSVSPCSMQFVRPSAIRLLARIPS